MDLKNDSCVAGCADAVGVACATLRVELLEASPALLAALETFEVGVPTDVVAFELVVEDEGSALLTTASVEVL